MRKQQKQFIILCVVLIAFIAIFLGLKEYTKHREEIEAAGQEEETVNVTTISIDEITEFSYQYESDTISFVKEEDVWYYKDDRSISIYQSMIETMLSKLEKITAEGRITESEDISEYGFGDPLNVIELNLGDTVYTVTIGMKNDITGQYYLMVSDDDTIYLTDSTIYNGFQKSVEDLTEEEDETDETEESDTLEE